MGLGLPVLPDCRRSRLAGAPSDFFVGQVCKRVAPVQSFMKTLMERHQEIIINEQPPWLESRVLSVFFYPMLAEIWTGRIQDRICAGLDDQSATVHGVGIGQGQVDGIVFYVAH